MTTLLLLATTAGDMQAAAGVWLELMMIGIVIGITWIIFPFIVMNKLNRIVHELHWANKREYERSTR